MDTHTNIRHIFWFIYSFVRLIEAKISFENPSILFLIFFRNTLIRHVMFYFTIQQKTANHNMCIKFAMRTQIAI